MSTNTDVTTLDQQYKQNTVTWQHKDMDKTLTAYLQSN